MLSRESPRAQNRLKNLLGHEFFAPSQWQRRAALWSGGILVGLTAILFAKASDLAFAGFERVLLISPLLPLVLTPSVFGLLAWLTAGVLKPTRGSGIPQVIATLGAEDAAFAERLLSLPVAFAKMLLTLLGLLAGASIGREGPTVHVGASLMYWLGRRFGFSDPKMVSRFILAGGGAGIAAAFNTPLAGVVFAIEELAGTYEHRFSGIVLTAVIFAGIVSLGILGDYTYFGRLDASIPITHAALGVVLCGVCGGLGGGLFTRLILLEGAQVLRRIEMARKRYPVPFAVTCGLVLALLGLLSSSSIYGTGYAQARALVHSTHGAAFAFGWEKLAANVLSYWAGIPGGIFSPALAVGAGMGHSLSGLFPVADAPAMVLLGMSAYLAGVTQAPITSAVISLELTANQSMVIPILAVCLLARGVSSLIYHTPVYRAFADRLIDEYQNSNAQTSSSQYPGR